jgi:hypothetical protein
MPQPWLGWTILGYGEYGGEAMMLGGVSSFIKQFIAPNNVVEIPLGWTAHMMERKMEWDFEFGGMMFGYEVFEPHITPFNSVVWFNN